MIHAPGIILPFNITSAQYRGQVVQEALDKFPNPLADGEAGKIAQIVNLMNSSGNWDQIDFKFGWYLTDEANALTSWRGAKTGINVNDVTFNNKGGLTNGTDSYIDTTIVPSTDLTNATQNDTHVESYVYDNLDSGASKVLFGTRNTSPFSNLLLFQTATTNITARVWTDNVGNINFTETGGLFQDKTRYGVHRDDSANHEIFKNGLEVASTAESSNVLSDLSMYVGSYNQSDVGTLHINARQSYFLIGGGFDLTALNTELNLEQSLFDLNT